MVSIGEADELTNLSRNSAVQRILQKVNGDRFLVRHGERMNSSTSADDLSYDRSIISTGMANHLHNKRPSRMSFQKKTGVEFATVNRVISTLRLMIAGTLSRSRLCSHLLSEIAI